MKIAAIVTDEQWAELAIPTTRVEWLRLADNKALQHDNDIAALFYLKNEATLTDYAFFTKPIFINSVSVTLREMNTTSNVVRMNGWNTFIQRSMWEIAGKIDNNIKDITQALNKNIIEVPDEPGLIAARIVGMIINEAYFALGDKVSTKKEMDVAMKLGTNYPYGPFEWGSIIGIKNILTLLQKLNVTDDRYKPAPMLITEATNMS